MQDRIECIIADQVLPWLEHEQVDLPPTAKLITRKTRTAEKTYLAYCCPHCGVISGDNRFPTEVRAGGPLLFTVLLPCRSGRTPVDLCICALIEVRASAARRIQRLTTRHSRTGRAATLASVPRCS